MALGFCTQVMRMKTILRLMTTTMATVARKATKMTKMRTRATKRQVP